MTQETGTFTAEITLSTEMGELPKVSEIERLIKDQMDGELDERTGLRCIGVYVIGRQDD